jgi:hypothetical protein
MFGGKEDFDERKCILLSCGFLTATDDAASLGLHCPGKTRAGSKDWVMLMRTRKVMSSVCMLSVMADPVKAALNKCL